MAPVSRREFFRRAGTHAVIAGVFAAGDVKLRANPLGLPIGSQTYPHRAALKENFQGLMKQMADIGIQRIELCSPLGYNDFAGMPKGTEIKKILDDLGLKCESCHFSMRELRERQAESLAWAKEVGITQIITASLGAGNNPTMDDVKKAADEYNKIAAVSAKAGLQQGLHNEGFELSTVDGKRTYDILLELLDPKLVKFQFQMSTISRGFVAAEYFTKYPGRFFSMHLQDVDLNAKPPEPPPGRAGRGGGGAQGVQTALGKGSVDWVKTFTAAKTGGVKNYFVEQNWDLTRESVAFLKTLKV